MQEGRLGPLDPGLCWLLAGFSAPLPQRSAPYPDSPHLQHPGEAWGGKGAGEAARPPEGSAGLHPQRAVPQDRVGGDPGPAGIRGRHQAEPCPPPYTAALARSPAFPKTVWPGSGARVPKRALFPASCPCQRQRCPPAGPEAKAQHRATRPRGFWVPMTGGPKANLVGTGLPSRFSGGREGGSQKAKPGEVCRAWFWCLWLLAGVGGAGLETLQPDPGFWWGEPRPWCVGQA